MENEDHLLATHAEWMRRKAEKKDAKMDASEVVKRGQAAIDKMLANPEAPAYDKDGKLIDPESFFDDLEAIDQFLNLGDEK